MVLPSTGNRISLGDIEDEFGQNNKRSIGDYRKRADDKLYPESFTGGLSFSSLDTGIPTISNLNDTTTPIRFSQFNGKKLNMVIDFFTGGTESRKNAKTRYDADKVTMIGGYASKPSSHSGKKATIFVNKTIHSDQNVNHRNVALTTGIFPDGFGTPTEIELIVHVGTNGKIIGSGGEGGRGGDNGNKDGSVGRDGSSALGLLTAASIVNNGTIQTGFGGGGGGAGFGQTRSTGKKSSRFFTAPGGGGGGGAGIPAGSGGAAGSAGDASASAGSNGQEVNSVAGGAGNEGSGAGGRSGGSDNTPTSERAPSGSDSNGAAGNLGGLNGFAIITTGDSAPTITGNSVVGRILIKQNPT